MPLYFPKARIDTFAANGTWTKQAGAKAAFGAVAEVVVGAPALPLVPHCQAAAASSSTTQHAG
jgi:hypothetical protein